MPVNPALGRLRQKDCKFETSLHRPCIKKQKKKPQKTNQPTKQTNKNPTYINRKKTSEKRKTKQKNK
jgi:hypothetical protein